MKSRIENKLKKKPLISPDWAPRLSKKEIARLYRADATGIYDEALINEVAFGILARCQSILTATEALRGRAACPVCRGIIKHTGKIDECLNCPDCEWQGPWRAYQKSFQRKQLVAGGMERFFEKYVNELPSARTPQEKMVMIDSLIHRCHHEQTHDISRPGAVNLIQGRMRAIIPFLDNLTYGENSAPTILETKSQWNEKVDRIGERWSLDWIKNRDEKIFHNQPDSEDHLK